MKVKEFLTSHSENFDLPLMLVTNIGVIRYYDSVLKYLSSNDDNFEYVNGCVQLDLNENDTFVIVYCKIEV